MGTAEVVAVRRHRRVDHPPRPARALARLSARLVRRGTLAIALGVAGLLALEALSFEQAYPDAASRAALTMWGKDPGIQIIAGPATAVDTVGGFAVWDAGLYLTLILGAWTLTTTTRVLRGDEDSGRSEILLAGPIGAVRALLTQLLVLLAASTLVGSVVALSLGLAGAQRDGAVLFGAAMAGYCGALVGLAAVASQVMATRRSALSASGAVLAAWILLRMVSNSAESRQWLGWLTPAGWTDKLAAFGENRWQVLLVPLCVTLGLALVATWLRQVRESGAGILAERRTRTMRSWGLSSPLTFAWRTNLGVLLAWATGVAAAGAVVGVLLPAVDEFLSTDLGFKDILAAMGMDAAELVRGFVGMWALILGLVMAVYTAFRMGAARAEEASTRAEFLLTRPLRRWRWLGGHVMALLASVLVLCTVAAASLWVGVLTTDVKVSAADAFSAMFNVLPLVVLFGGLSVLVLGAAPRLTVPVGAAAPVVAYVVELVGPLLEWPDWVLGLSPFHHVEAVPVDAFGWPAALVMAAIGLAFAAAGLVAFERRDLVGA